MALRFQTVRHSNQLSYRVQLSVAVVAFSHLHLVRSNQCTKFTTENPSAICSNQSNLSMVIYMPDIISCILYYLRITKNRNVVLYSFPMFRLNQSYQYAGRQPAFLLRGPPGKPGRDGTPGSAGRNGRDGRDGSQGVRGI